MADVIGLAFAARATASFPGAFPPFNAREMDATLKARGEQWGPYRTYASLYLWRVADFVAEIKAPTRHSQD